MAETFDVIPRPDGYKPPEWQQVRTLATQLRAERQGKLDKIGAAKKAIRGNWEDVLRRIPAAYRNVQPSVDYPEIRDMLRRIVGRIAKNEPMTNVMAPSPRTEDIKAAAKEEARLAAVRKACEDQQDESIYGLGVDSQCSWGESWLSVLPDPTRFARGDANWDRGTDETPKQYSDRYANQMAAGRVPILMQIHDPQTVLPFFSRGRLAVWIAESEHSEIDINLGLGYHALKTGEKSEWVTNGTLSDPYVSRDLDIGGSRITDPNHDTGTSGGGGGSPGKRIKSHVYLDDWCYQRYLDGVLVEQWEHNLGMVPTFPAWGIQSSDRDPEYHSVGIIDTALVIARQIIYFSAMLASNAMQHGWPTPFLKNPEHGLVHPVTGRPLVREVELGKMNLLGPNEDIVFPYLQANMTDDFYKYMELLTRAFEGSSLANFGGNINSDTSGYAVAQVRALQDALLGPIYTSAARQWRKAAYFTRHLVRQVFPAGIYLPGAIEMVEVDGKDVQYRPVLEYAKEHTTDFPIDVTIQEGIVQDELAERKSAIEMNQAGIWSKRRTMEKTGVEDAAAESEEIAIDRVLSSPAADQSVMQIAMAIAAQRYQATRVDMSSPFYQALSKAQQEMLGQGANMPANQPGAGPQNAEPGGQPISQSGGDVTPPPSGGPTAGPQPGTGLRMEDLAVPQMAGGVAGGQGGAGVS